jgi:hypothetical protein
MEIPKAASPQSLSVALIGTWELLARADRTQAGELRIDPSLGADPIALLFFDRQGHFAAQFMKRERGSARETEPANPAPNNSRARGGYDAYFGTYQVDESLGTVTTRLVGALSPENVGQVFARTMSVRDNELTICLETQSTAGEAIVRTLRWQRVG